MKKYQKNTKIVENTRKIPNTKLVPNGFKKYQIRRSGTKKYQTGHPAVSRRAVMYAPTGPVGLTSYQYWRAKRHLDRVARCVIAKMCPSGRFSKASKKSDACDFGHVWYFMTLASGNPDLAGVEWMYLRVNRDVGIVSEEEHQADFVGHDRRGDVARQVDRATLDGGHVRHRIWKGKEGKPR